jgi:hypothetical protein
LNRDLKLFDVDIRHASAVVKEEEEFAAAEEKERQNQQQGDKEGGGGRRRGSPPTSPSPSAAVMTLRAHQTDRSEVLAAMSEVKERLKRTSMVVASGSDLLANEEVRKEGDRRQMFG